MSASDSTTKATTTYYGLGSSGWTLGEAPLSLELFKTQLGKFMVDQVTVGSSSRGRLAEMTSWVPLATSSDPVSQKNLQFWLSCPGPPYSAWEYFCYCVGTWEQNCRVKQLVPRTQYPCHMHFRRFYFGLGSTPTNIWSALGEILELFSWFSSKRNPVHAHQDCSMMWVKVY